MHVGIESLSGVHLAFFDVLVEEGLAVDLEVPDRLRHDLLRVCGLQSLPIIYALQGLVLGVRHALSTRGVIDRLRAIPFPIL